MHATLNISSYVIFIVSTVFQKYSCIFWYRPYHSGNAQNIESVARQWIRHNLVIIYILKITLHHDYVFVTSDLILNVHVIQNTCRALSSNSTCFDLLWIGQTADTQQSTTNRNNWTLNSSSLRRPFNPRLSIVGYSSQH